MIRASRFILILNSSLAVAHGASREGSKTAMGAATRICGFSSCIGTAGSKKESFATRRDLVSGNTYRFLVPPSILNSSESSSTLFMASKNKKGRNKRNKGFAKKEENDAGSKKESTTATTSDDDDNTDTATYFESIEQTGGDALFSAKSNLDIDSNLSPEERTKQILKKQYGLRTFEDQQMDLKKSEQREKLAALKKKADSGQDIDVFQLIPAPLLIFIDRFLKIGLGISTLIFVAAGVGITLEAWSVASGSPLPSNVDSFIVQTIEPNFTYMLLILLTFSISLGLFATAQLGSDTSQYSEK